jgi:hypothetical protein
VNVVIGAYAAADLGWDVDQLVSFYRDLAELPAVAGLELPVAQLEALLAEPALVRTLPGHWRLDITSLPGTMHRRGSLPEYGLASTSTSGRQAALADLHRLRRTVERTNTLLGPGTVRSVVVVSAPTRDPSQPAGRPAAAFTESLHDLGAHDWSGASILVEHCDAAVAGQLPAKGFLDIHDEVDAVAAVTPAPVRVMVNWGRSAIERRDPGGAVEHAAVAASRGVLGGVVFSGCAASDSDWGGPWADTHLPPTGVSAAGTAEHASLMDHRRMTDLLRVAGPQPCVGLKVSVRPRRAGRATRRALLTASLEAMVHACTAAGQA